MALIVIVKSDEARLINTSVVRCKKSTFLFIMKLLNIFILTDIFHDI